MFIFEKTCRCVRSGWIAYDSGHRGVEFGDLGGLWSASPSVTSTGALRAFYWYITDVISVDSSWVERRSAFAVRDKVV